MDTAMAPDDEARDLTLSERVARASGVAPVELGDGTYLVEIEVHPLEPSTLPRPRFTKQTVAGRLRTLIVGRSSDQAKVRYVNRRPE